MNRLAMTEKTRDEPYRLTFGEASRLTTVEELGFWLSTISLFRKESYITIIQASKKQRWLAGGYFFNLFRAP